MQTKNAVGCTQRTVVGSGSLPLDTTPTRTSIADAIRRQEPGGVSRRKEERFLKLEQRKRTSDRPTVTGDAADHEDENPRHSAGTVMTVCVSTFKRIK